MTRKLIGALSGAALAFVFQAAGAAATITTDMTGTVALSIQDVIIDGTAYDVTFGMPGDTTFAGNISGATDAVNAIDNVLNDDSDVTSVYDSYEGADVSYFYVTYNPTAPMDQADAAFGYYEDPWTNIGYSVSEPTLDADAVFTAAAPEPGSVVLVLSGFAGIAIGARRRRKS